jgi:hypothetical protein
MKGKFQFSILACLLLFSLSAFGQSQPSDTLQAQLFSLAPWLQPLFLKMAELRLVMVFISGPLQAKLSEIVSNVVASADTDDDHWLELVLCNRAYQITTFVVNAILSVKLPTLGTFEAALAAKNPTPQP